MMTEEQIHRQQLRLKNVKNDEWVKALDALTEEMSNSKLLGGHIEKGPHNTKRLVNGKTQYGAHSEYTLGTSNVLYHYQAEFVMALYYGKWEWKEGVSLADQLIEIAYSRIPKTADKYARRKEREKKNRINTTPVSLDVEMIGKLDDYTGEETEMLVAAFKPQEDDDNPKDCDETTEIPTEAEGFELMNKESAPAGMDYQHSLWGKVCNAADDDKELECFVQVTGECKEMKEVNERLDLKDGDRDRLQKRLKRKVNKLN